MKLILEKSQKQFAKNLPFVLYNKPNNNTIAALFQKDDALFEVGDFTEKGFIFASFDGCKTFLIPEDNSETLSATFIPTETTYCLEIETELINELEKNNYQNLVKKGIQTITTNNLQKVVLSRKETLDLVDFDLIATFEKLVHLYPSTFVYCFYHPKVGIWLGATPEQLLKSNNSIFETIALAGTQKATSSNIIIWSKKEQEEQQYVTDYILKTLKNIASDVSVSNPYSIKAGSIWHIKTDISGTLNKGFGLQSILQLLHPTPAVCGLPKDLSKAFIIENENYNRTFYTGFLGELNRDNKTDLFVNLRCMEISNSQAHLFMGCGITKDSIPEKEWEESVNKSATMKRILDCKF